MNPKKRNNPNEFIQIEFIKDRLRKGFKREDFISTFRKKWQSVSVRTFDERLKHATIAMQAELAHIRQKVDEGVANEIELRKGRILGTLERQEYLTKVVNAEIKEEFKRPVFNPDRKKFEIITTETRPQVSDGIKAIAELNKMDGSYAAQKLEVNDTTIQINRTVISKKV